LSIEGGIGGESRKFSFDVQFPGEASEHEFIPRLWATRRVGYLLDEIRLRGENKELRDEVTDLARKYGIVTPYTAYLIVEDESRRGVAMERRTWSFGSAPAQDAARDLYMTMQLEKSGGQAVAGARSSLDLKTAGQASDALASVNVESFRAAPQVRSFASGSGMVNGLRAASPTVNAGAVPALQAARQVAEQVRYVHGRSFFQNGEKWVDSEVQRQTHSAQRIRVQFSSPEYFTLQEKNPSVRPWLALGRNIEFVLGPRIYEIYE
jgi:Ca-activated chloride channel family protein